MAQTVKDAITGRKKNVIKDNKLYDAITGRQLGFFRNGYLVSFSTGRNLEWITISDGADVSGVTAEASDVAADKYFVNANGDLLTGTMENVVADIQDNVVIVNPGIVRERQNFTVPEARYPEKEQNTLTVYKGYIPQDIIFTFPPSGGTDISDSTVTADVMLEGIVGYNADGTRYIGNIPTVVASRNANTVTVPKGYIAKEQTLSVPTVTANLSANVVIVPVGYIAERQTLTVAEMTEPSLSENVVTIGRGYNKTQKTVTVAEAGTLSVTDNIVTVPVGYIKTARTATIPVAAEPTVMYNKVTVNKGYVSEQKTLTVAEAAEPTISGNVVTINKGYQTEQKKIKVGTSVAAKTYTPGKTDQTIAEGSYLAGKQTIRGDANLVAENIADGKTIFGISGTHKGNDNNTVKFGIIDADGNFQAIDLSGDVPADSGDAQTMQELIMFNTGHDEPEYPAGGGGTIKFYECASCNEADNSWTGYKLTQNTETNEWVKSEGITTGLEIKGYTPVVGSIYNQDTTIMASKVLQPVAGEMMALYHFDSSWDDATGKTTIQRNDYIYQFDTAVKQFGTASAKMTIGVSYNSGYGYTITNENCGEITIKNLPEMDAFTIEWWQKSGGTSDYTIGKAVAGMRNPTLELTAPETAIQRTFYTISHVAFVRKQGSSTVTMYINGVAKGTTTLEGTFGGRDVYFWGLSRIGSNSWSSYIDELAIFNYAKYDGDFEVPTAPYVVE